MTPFPAVGMFPSASSHCVPTPDQTHRRSRHQWCPLVWMVGILASASLTAGCYAPAEAQATGRAQCHVTENGQPASGTLSLRKENGPEVAKGACGDAIAVPPGRYTAIISLDGALDGPQQRQTVQVQANGLARLNANFATAILEVRIEADGRRVAGMAIIRSQGRQIGTLGSGVAAHISAGEYEIVARYRTQERRFESVRLTAGERRELVASF